MGREMRFLQQEMESLYAASWCAAGECLSGHHLVFYSMYFRNVRREAPCMIELNWNRCKPQWTAQMTTEELNGDS
jgi:hypothetical protein